MRKNHREDILSLGGVRPWALVSGGWDNSAGVLG